MALTPAEQKAMYSRIGKRSAAKGGSYEREVAKKICSFFGLNPKQWEQYWLRTKRTTGGQPHGDILPLPPVADYWYGAGLGPIEAKNRQEWSFMELFKNPSGSKLYGYWTKSNADTSSDNSIVFFTKSYAPDFVFYQSDVKEYDTSISILIEEKTFLIVRLEHFLTYYFPNYGPKD